MSKIARVYHLGKEIQKIYKDGVLKKLFFDWKKYIGEEINIEYAKECRADSVVINGKTYQNLLKPINSTNWSGEGCEITDNYIKLIQSGYTEDIRTSCDLLKSGTKYTLVYNVKNHTLSSKAFVLKGSTEEKFIVNNNITLPIDKGINKFTFTTSSTKTNVSLFSLGISSGSLDGEYIELSDIILLEGDYINTNLPSNINGIESVGEREFVNTPTEYYPVTIRNYNYKCKTDGIVLPNGVKNSIDTIDEKKVHTRRVGAVLLNGTQDMALSNVNQTLTTRVRIRMDNAKVSKNNLLCNWFIRTGAHGDYEYIIIQDSSVDICLFISVLNTKLSAPTADGVKQYFNENPLLVFYELATPIYTYLESGIYDEIIIPTPSNIRNEIYSENGKWYHKRNIGKAIFDGSSDENWNYYNKGGIQRFDIKMSNDAKMYSTRKPVYAVGYQFDASKNEDKTIFISGVETVNKLYIYNHAYTSVEDFRSYLAKNPLEVYYELAEPVISELHFSDIVYKLSQPLRSLPNGTCDIIEGNELVQRVGKVVLDGVNNKVYKHIYTNDIYLCVTYGDTTFSSSSDVLNLMVTGSIPVASKDITRMVTKKDASFEGINKRNNYNYGIFIRVPISFASTADEFNTYLQQNPMTVYYPLAEPVETQLDLPTITIKEGTNLITTTNNIKPNIQAESLVRSGFQNMCDNAWVNGDISVDSGAEYSSGSSRIKLKDYIQVQPNTTYYCDTFSETVYSGTGKIGVRYYKNDKTFISGGGIGIAKTSYNKFTTPEDCYYIKFIVETLDTNYKMYLRPVK